MMNYILKVLTHFLKHNYLLKQCHYDHVEYRRMFTVQDTSTEVDYIRLPSSESIVMHRVFDELINGLT